MSSCWLCHRGETISICLLCHTGETTSTCLLCHKGEKLSSSLLRHSGESTSTCLLCHRGEKLSSCLLRHRGESTSTCLLCHRGEKLSSCLLCHRGKKISSCLPCHKRSFKMLPFACPTESVCDGGKWTSGGMCATLWFRSVWTRSPCVSCRPQWPAAFLCSTPTLSAPAQSHPPDQQKQNTVLSHMPLGEKNT